MSMDMERKMILKILYFIQEFIERIIIKLEKHSYYKEWAEQLNKDFSLENCLKMFKINGV